MANIEDTPKVAAEKRRPGRARTVSPTLIPLLRGSSAPATDSARPFTGGTGTNAQPSRPKACAACKTASPLFPFTMAFQPIVDLQQGRIDSYEALVRGPGGEAAAHVLAKVTPENMYAFDQACRVKAIELAARLGVDRQLSINFLPNAVYEPRACIQATLETAARTGFPRDRLTFEILESETIADTGHLLAIIKEYRKHGFRIALDDFGTGYSGLARLAELRPDSVKVDRALVQDCDKDALRLAIIAGIIAIGKTSRIKVIFEGAERAGEVTALRLAGAQFIQGFFIARPAFEAILRDGDIAWSDLRG